jgi:methionine-R-sulfoxide reductase
LSGVPPVKLHNAKDHPMSAFRLVLALSLFATQLAGVWAGEPLPLDNLDFTEWRNDKPDRWVGFNGATSGGQTPSRIRPLPGRGVELSGDASTGKWTAWSQHAAVREGSTVRLLFEARTEAAFSSPLDKEKRRGTFVCAACYLPLFSSDAKFDSGTGWPSFYQPIDGRVGTKRDYWLVLPRTEYHCIRCGGHQGHVFNDGPAPTGQRWCNNGVALSFVPDGDALPGLRT